MQLPQDGKVNAKVYDFYIVCVHRTAKMDRMLEAVALSRRQRPTGTAQETHHETQQVRATVVRHIEKSLDGCFVVADALQKRVTRVQKVDGTVGVSAENVTESGNS